MNVDNFGYNNISPLQSEKFRASHAVASNYAIDDIDDIDDEDGGYVLIIDPRRLDRECLSQCLSLYNPAMNIRMAESIDDWGKQQLAENPSAILLVFSGTKVSDPGTCEKISNVVEAFKRVPVIVIADSDDLGEIMKAVEMGARGYIPTISVVQDRITFSDPEFHKREARLIGSRNATAEDFEVVMAALRSGAVRAEALLSERIALADLPTRLPELAADRGRLIKAIVILGAGL